MMSLKALNIKFKCSHQFLIFVFIVKWIELCLLRADFTNDMQLATFRAKELLTEYSHLPPTFRWLH